MITAAGFVRFNSMLLSLLFFKRSMLIPVFLWVLIWESSNWPSLSISLIVCLV